MGTTRMNTIDRLPANLLRRLPGVTAGNRARVCARARSLRELFCMGQKDMAEALGNSIDAKRLHTFVN